MRKILVATDFSDVSRAAVRRAAALAGRREAELFVLHAFEADAYGASQGDERNAMQLLLNDLCGGLQKTGVKVAGMLIDGYADEVIPATARNQSVDLVVVGSHGRTGGRRLLVGSVAERVVRASEIPVLVARGPALAGYERILVATDFGAQADAALACALDLAVPGARVEIMHVVQVPLSVGAEPAAVSCATLLPQLASDAQRRGDALVARLARGDLELGFSAEVGGPRDAILRRVEAGSHDQVAVGSHGRRGLRRLVIGSVAESIVRLAPCSVLVGR